MRSKSLLFKKTPHNGQLWGVFLIAQKVSLPLDRRSAVQYYIISLK